MRNRKWYIGLIVGVYVLESVLCKVVIFSQEQNTSQEKGEFVQEVLPVQTSKDDMQKSDQQKEKKGELKEESKDKPKALIENKRDEKKREGDAAVAIDEKLLLSITDGEFRYTRIPGITVQEKIKESPVAVQEFDTSQQHERGLFGLSKKASDRLAKIVLIATIVIIFVLYKSRTRNKRGTVLRRFPK